MDAKISPNRLPTLPNLSFEIALQIFTDTSLRPTNATSASRTDNEVLAQVGQSACHTIVTTFLFQRKPPLTAEEIALARDELLFGDTLTTWIGYYRDIIDSVRCLPGTEHTNELLTRVWYAYMGGIHLTHGYHVLESFLRQLLDPTSEPTPTPAPKPIPHLPQPNHPVHAPSPSKPETHGQYISSLHMEAVKRGVRLDYDYESSGPQHALRWTVHVLADGEHQGTGQASSKQNAKEEAAKAAFINLGW